MPVKIWTFRVNIKSVKATQWLTRLQLKLKVSLLYCIILYDLFIKLELHIKRLATLQVKCFYILITSFTFTLLRDICMSHFCTEYRCLECDITIPI